MGMVTALDLSWREIPVRRKSLPPRSSNEGMTCQNKFPKRRQGVSLSLIFAPAKCQPSPEREMSFGNRHEERNGSIRGIAD